MISLGTDGYFWPKRGRAQSIVSMGAGVMSPPEAVPASAPEVCIEVPLGPSVAASPDSPQVSVSFDPADVRIDADVGPFVEVEPC